MTTADLHVPAYGLSSTGLPHTLSTEVDAQTVTLDLSSVRFCDPLGLVRIAGVADWHRRQGRSVTIVPPNDENVRNYLSRMHLASALPEEVNCPLPTMPERDRRDVLIELSCYTQTWDSELEERLVSLMVPGNGSAVPISESVALGVQELVANATEHSRSASGAFLAAQAFPSQQRCVVAVGDTGKGIPGTLQLPGLSTAHDVISRALVRGISGTGDPLRGQGLCEIATEAQQEDADGFLELWSDDGYVKARRTGDAWVPEQATAAPQTRGTWVRLTLQT